MRGRAFELLLTAHTARKTHEKPTKNTENTSKANKTINKNRKVFKFKRKILKNKNLNCFVRFSTSMYR